METIQVVLDSKLLRAAEAAARRAKLNRSALVRVALREHLKRIAVLDLEQRDREGYKRVSRRPGDLADWEAEAAWPLD
jgi:metal-responsive CopG/Arc/MetJ family transcriptional regulator